MEQPDRLKKFILQDGNPIQKIWDTSSLSSFLSCPRMYNWTNLQGYKSKTYGMATGFGSALMTVNSIAMFIFAVGILLNF